MKLNKTKTALTVGAFLGTWHAFWSVLVALNLAEPVLRIVLWLHFLSNPYHVNAFYIGRALALILVTSVLGAVLGWLFAALWNWLQKES